MLKRIVALLVCVLAFGGMKAYADGEGDLVELEVRIIDEIPSIPGGAKTPTLFPTVWQDGYELEIDTPHDEYVLNIVSGNTIVYSVVVYSTVSLVVLPATLSGTYELQLIHDDLCFYGYIDL
jgi:hypothetical protein